MHEVQVKGILSAGNGMNLYRGCSHGCIYCDARSECYQFDHAFTDIEVKSNAPERLEEALRRKQHKCMIATGAMSDPYLHCEEEIGLTRRALTVIEKYGFGIAVQTKSDRILRDMDLYRKIHRQSKCVIEMTLTTADEALCAKIEPHVCGTHRRYEVLKAFQAEGIPTVVWITPILPYINDSMENLNGILEYCLDAGVKGIVSFGMGVTLRKGDREYFYEALDRHFPGMKERYIASFGNAYECPSPNESRLMERLIYVCQKNGILYDPKEIFAWIGEFPKVSGGQMSFL